jgi:molybdopterin-guanine dinucleotide biosynthesis protein A
MGGRAKGLLALAPGRRVLDAPLAALRATCAQVVVDSTDPRVHAALPDLEAVVDGTTGLGALGAIRTALAAAATRGADAVLACAWDMPGVTPTLLATLHEALVADDTVDVALPRHAGTLEPLCAAWRTRALAACDAAIADGTRAAHRFVATLDARVLEGAALEAVGDPMRLLVNVNTDDDLAGAARLLAS